MSALACRRHSSVIATPGAGKRFHVFFFDFAACPYAPSMWTSKAKPADAQAHFQLRRGKRYALCSGGKGTQSQRAVCAQELTNVFSLAISRHIRSAGEAQPPPHDSTNHASGILSRIENKMQEENWRATGARCTSRTHKPHARRARRENSYVVGCLARAASAPAAWNCLLQRPTVARTAGGGGTPPHVQTCIPRCSEPQRIAEDRCR